MTEVLRLLGCFLSNEKCQELTIKGYRPEVVDRLLGELDRKTVGAPNWHAFCHQVHAAVILDTMMMFADASDMRSIQKLQPVLAPHILEDHREDVETKVAAAFELAEKVRRGGLEVRAGIPAYTGPYRAEKLPDDY